MSDVVSVSAARTHMSRLLARVEAGEEITITRRGRPVARLVPFSVRRQPRVPGLLAGQIWMAPDFDSPEFNEEIARDFGV